MLMMLFKRKLSLLVLLVVFGESSGAWAATIYEFRSRPAGITWQSAQDESIADGGSLAAITSVAVNTFVLGLVDEVVISTGVWLGGFQPPGSPEPDGNWQWVTGDPFSYANWHAGEPNDVGGEDGISFFTFRGDVDPTWNDVPRTVLLDGYIFSATVVPEPNTALLLGFGLVGLGIKRRRRQAVLH